MEMSIFLSGFDLEARIDALPSLNLEEFTIRKKEKKRAINGLTREYESSPNSPNEDLNDFSIDKTGKGKFYFID